MRTPLNKATRPETKEGNVPSTVGTHFKKADSLDDGTKKTAEAATITQNKEEK